MTAIEGIPQFWMQAMKNNPTSREWIYSQDEAALSFLRNIQVKFLDSKDQGFELVFEFDKNPFFRNTTLTKKFTYEQDKSGDDIYGELENSKVIGCDIGWMPGRDLTEGVAVSPGKLSYFSLSRPPGRFLGRSILNNLIW